MSVAVLLPLHTGGVALVQPPLGSLTPVGGATVAVLLTWAVASGENARPAATSAHADTRRMAANTERFETTQIPLGHPIRALPPPGAALGRSIANDRLTEDSRQFYSRATGIHIENVVWFTETPPGPRIQQEPCHPGTGAGLACARRHRPACCASRRRPPHPAPTARQELTPWVDFGTARAGIATPPQRPQAAVRSSAGLHPTGDARCPARMHACAPAVLPHPISFPCP